MPASEVSFPPPLVRFPTLFPGQMGVPGTDHNRGERMHCTGEVFYVDPNYPGVDDRRDGTSPTDPLSTVAAALTHCQAYRGDVIAVMTNAYWQHATQALGYATPIAEEVIVTVPGVRIMGLFPSSSLGVPWRVTQNGGIAITVHAIDVLIEGFCFYEPTYTTPVGILAEWGGPAGVYGDNLTVRHCSFDSTMDCGIQLDFSYYTHIHGNYFESIITTAILNNNTIGDPDFAHIHDNTFSNCTNAIKLLDSDDCFIYNNRIYGDGGGTNNFIDLTGGGGNVVSQNVMSCTLGAEYTATCTAGGTDSWIHNYLENGVTTMNP